MPYDVPRQGAARWRGAEGGWRAAPGPPVIASTAPSWRYASGAGGVDDERRVGGEGRVGDHGAALGVERRLEAEVQPPRPGRPCPRDRADRSRRRAGRRRRFARAATRAEPAVGAGAARDPTVRRGGAAIVRGEVTAAPSRIASSGARAGRSAGALVRSSATLRIACLREAFAVALMWVRSKCRSVLGRMGEDRDLALISYPKYALI